MGPAQAAPPTPFLQVWQDPTRAPQLTRLGLLDAALVELLVDRVLVHALPEPLVREGVEAASGA